MPGQYEELACPFCDKGKISCLYFPSVKSQKTRSTSALGKVTHFTKSQDIWLIQSGCSVCGKSKEEVEKKLRKNNII